MMIFPEYTDEQKRSFDATIRQKGSSPNIYLNSDDAVYHYFNVDTLDSILTYGLLPSGLVESTTGLRLEGLAVVHQQYDKTYFTNTDYFNIGHIPFWMWRSKRRKSEAGHILEDYGQGCARIAILRGPWLTFEYDCEASVVEYYTQMTGVWFTTDRVIPPELFVFAQRYSIEKDCWEMVSVPGRMRELSL